MSLALDDLPRGSDRLLQQLQQTTEVIAAQNASLLSLQAKHDAVLAELDAAQAEIEKLRLLIRQLQRNRFGRRSGRVAPRARRRPPPPRPPPPRRAGGGRTPHKHPGAAAEAAQEELAAKNRAP